MKTQLSEYDKRKLFRIKLLFIGIIVILTIQFVLPRDRSKEAWPIMRWDMFTDTINPPNEQGTIKQLAVVAYAVDGQAFHFDLDSVYSSTQITSPAATTESILAFIVQEIDLTVQAQTRTEFFKRLSYLSEVEIVEVEVLQQNHDYDIAADKFPDMENPSSSELILILTPDETLTSREAGE